MATVNHTRVEAEGGSHVVTWGPLITGSLDGDPVAFAGAPDRSVAITGTFDSATLTMQGSNDGTNWFSLTDPQGNAIAKTAAGLETIMELTRYVRPLVSSVGASTSLTVTLMLGSKR